MLPIGFYEITDITAYGQYAMGVIIILWQILRRVILLSLYI
jgi:hypothetical protein